MNMSLRPSAKGPQDSIWQPYFLRYSLANLLLLEHMGFDLVDGRLDLGEMLNVQIPVGAEVGHADGTELAGLIKFLHRPVSAIIIAKRLMDEQQVEIIGTQLVAWMPRWTPWPSHSRRW